MAPKRKPTTPPTAVRRSPRLANAAVTPPADDPEPRKKRKTSIAAAASTSTATAASTSTATPTAASTSTAAAVQEDEAKVSPPPAVEGPKTIIIEHCKQCSSSFKTKALQVKKALEKDVAGVNVVVNPEKPRRGCFEIREEGGEIFVSLLDIQRPFPPLKKLDMEALISDIVDKIR